MKKMSLMLRKCKSLSRQLGRSYSYSSLRSQSAREGNIWSRDMKKEEVEDPEFETVLVGSTRKRYVISSKHLKHPLLNALIKRSNQKHRDNHKNNGVMVVKCEVVLFDHLLWLLENGDQNLILDSLDELADLYLF